MPDQKDDPILDLSLGPFAWLIPVCCVMGIVALMVIVGVGLKSAHRAPKSPACFVIEMDDHTRWWVCPAGTADHA